MLMFLGVFILLTLGATPLGWFAGIALIGAHLGYRLGRKD